MFIVVAMILLALFAAGVVAWRKYSRLFDKPSNEVVQLDNQRRQTLARLKSEEKFEPNEYPPLGYTGVATPEEGAIARAAVNNVLDTILSRENGPLPARTVSDLIGRSMKQVNQLETEDRDRTAGYMIEIWYILGFKGATGRFAYGAAFPKPAGHREPLPPGWKSPTEPRPIH